MLWALFGFISAVLAIALVLMPLAHWAESQRRNSVSRPIPRHAPAPKATPGPLPMARRPRGLEVGRAA